MRLGVNLTSPYTADVPLALLRAGDAAFCEVMVDNFLHLDADAYRETLGEGPVAFHVMNSHFFDGPEARAAGVARRLRALTAELRPLYVSDHLAHFYHAGRLLPVLHELDYASELDAVAERVARWQDAIGCQVWLENFPSVFERGEAQAAFYAALCERTGCGVLFDFSNAVVAELNCGAAARGWLPQLRGEVHGHVAGYTFAEGPPRLAVDSHDAAVSELSLAFLRDFAAQGATGTLVVERDDDLDVAKWRQDLANVKAALHA